MKMYSDLRFSPAPKIHLAITSTQIQFTLSMACTPTSWRESVPKTGTDSILSYLARGALWLASELKEKQVKGMKVWGVTGWSFMMAAVEVLRDIRTFILETSQAWRTHLHWKQVFEQIFNARWYGNLHTNTKISEKERQWLVELSREIRGDWLLLYLGGWGSYGRWSKKLSESLEGMEPRPSDLCSHALPLSYRELDVDPEHSSPKFVTSIPHTVSHIQYLYLFAGGGRHWLKRKALWYCVF